MKNRRVFAFGCLLAASSTAGAVGLSATLTACGTTTTDVAATAPLDAGSEASVEPTDIVSVVKKYDGDMAKAICAKLASCCNTSEYAIFFDNYLKTKNDDNAPFDLEKAPPPQACERLLTEQLHKRNVAKWTPSVTRGRMKFDPAKAKSCLDALATATCGTPIAKALYDVSCFDLRDNEVFTKIAPLGASCQDIADGTYSGECNRAEGYCGEAGDGGTVMVCRPWQKAGEDCQFSDPRRFCDQVTTRCGTSTCAPVSQKKIGEACSFASDSCERGSFCDGAVGNDAATNLCVAMREDGAKCFKDDECKSAYAYTCSSATPTGPKTCGSARFCVGK